MRSATSSRASATPATRSSAPRMSAAEKKPGKAIKVLRKRANIVQTTRSRRALQRARGLTKNFITGGHWEVTSQRHTLAGNGDTRMKHPFRFWMTSCVAVVMASLGGGRALASERHPLTQSSRYRVTETIERIEACAHKHGLSVFARLDHKPAPHFGEVGESALLVF